MTSREWSRRAVDPRARERLGALAAPASPEVPTVSPVDGDPGATADADDLLARLRSGALTAAATAYTAAHGHPLERPDPLDATPPRRWAVTPRSAVVVALVLLAVAAVVVLRAWTSPPDVVPLDDAAARAQVTDPFDVAEARVVVHVVGEVAAPGVVELPVGARVAEAVEAAGGATPRAVLGSVNLARVVTDGEQILVPAAGGDPDDGAAAPVVASDGRVDLNAADAATLESLPGIGPVLASRIIEWRTQHGRFSSVEELAEVSGIGPSLLERLSELVRT